ncbi:MAG: hypothetical protein NZL94_09100 [Meiothermus sp.]|uniref:hypothetical protein n=1 Tax=Meiothermus sp. TaxID=1955249 RepID=UPI00261B5A29|nr:hypothetical protein [Meiothermus sp.]MCS7059020.1 hypothetical protein [Meiothermus sp.]
MESTLTASRSAPGPLPRSPQQPVRLVLHRPQPKCTVRVAWEAFRMSKAWGEAMELYGLQQGA